MSDGASGRAPRRWWRALALAALLASPAGADAAGAGARAGPGGFTVEDATGRPVGEVVELYGPSALVAVKADGRVGLVRVTGGRFLEGLTSVVYDGPGCTGTPFLVSILSLLPGLPEAFPHSGIGTGGRLYVSTGPPEDRGVASLLTQGTTCSPFGGVASVLPAAELVDLDAFVFPLALRPAGPEGAP